MNEIIMHLTSDNQMQVEVQFEGENFWLTKKQISKLFERYRTLTTKSLQNIFKQDELDEQVVCRNFPHTTTHGALKFKTQQKEVKYFNLAAILSVCYRVNSKHGTRFHQWATQH